MHRFRTVQQGPVLPNSGFSQGRLQCGDLDRDRSDNQDGILTITHWITRVDCHASGQFRILALRMYDAIIG